AGGRRRRRPQRSVQAGDQERQKENVNRKTRPAVSPFHTTAEQKARLVSMPTQRPPPLPACAFRRRAAGGERLHTHSKSSREGFAGAALHPFGPSARRRPAPVGTGRLLTQHLGGRRISSYHINAQHRQRRTPTTDQLRAIDLPAAHRTNDDFRRTESQLRRSSERGASPPPLSSGIRLLLPADARLFVLLAPTDFG